MESDSSKPDNMDENNSAGSKLLRRAARDGQLDAVNKALNEMNALINSVDGRGWTALHLACGQKNRKEIVELLLSIPGVNINARTNEQSTPLIVAAFNGRTEICRVLLDAGADASLQDHVRDTALTIARTRGKKAIVKMLEEHIATVSPKEGEITYLSKRVRTEAEAVES